MKDKIKLALIDDHQIFLEGLKNLLNQEKDLEVIYVTNKAIDFIQTINHHVFDILIVDISMPELNGLELIEELKKKDFSPHIIVLSSYAEAINEELVDAAVLKEISNSELIKIIREVYNGSYKKKKTSSTIKINSTFLSSREKEIINCVAEGKTVNEIASQLVLSKHTIESHKKNIFLKLEISNNAELIKKAMMLGIIKI